MRKLLLVIGWALLASTAPLLAVEGHWQTLGPDGGSVYDLAFQRGNAQVMYASVVGGVFKSRDGGANWSWAGSGLDSASATFNVAVDPVQASVVYVAQRTGVFKSVDGGVSWRSTGRPAAYRVVTHPRISGRVFAATELGLFRSSNGGGTWTPLTQGLPELYRATLIVFDPASVQRLYASVEDRSTGARGLFQSVDGGTAWQRLPGGPLENEQVYSLAFDPRAPRTLYAGAGSGVFKSTNGGAVWRATGLVSTDLVPVGIVWNLKPHPRLSGVLFAGTSTGLFRSGNGGTTWARVARGLPDQGVTAFAFSPASAQTVYAGIDTEFLRGGVLKSADGGRSWVLSSKGLSALTITSFAVDPENSDILWVVANGLPFRSTDRGRTWARVRPGMNEILAVQIAVNPTDGSNVYILTVDENWRTFDGGRTWEIVQGLGRAEFYTRLIFDPRVSTTLYATQFGVLKSTDGGSTWASLPGGVGGMFVSDFAVAPSAPSTLYATGSVNGQPRVVRSMDGGATWTQIQQGLPNSLQSLAVDPLVSTTVYGTIGGTIYRSVDGGNSWRIFDETFHSLSALPLTLSSSRLLYAGVYGDNVYQTDVEGDTWEPLGTNPFPVAYTFGSLVIDPNDPCRIYAGTIKRGLLAFTKSGTAECN